MISFFAFTAFGAIFQWSQTWQFWFGLSGGNTRTASPLYVGNQSLLGVVYRLIGETTALTLLGLAISGLVALLGCRGRQPLVAGGGEGVRGGARRPVHLPGLAVVLDPPPRVGAADGCGGGARSEPAALGAPARRRLGDLGERLPSRWRCSRTAGDPERNYTFLQQVIANLGPLLGLALVAGLGWQMVSAHRKREVAAVT